jgi:hypothetical protein
VEFLRLLLRYVHLVGFALLFGAWVAQYVTGKLRVNVIMRTGLGTMIGTGLLLAIPFPSGVDLDYVKLGVKLVIALGIGALFGWRSPGNGPRRPSPVHYSCRSVGSPCSTLRSRSSGAERHGHRDHVREPPHGSHHVAATAGDQAAATSRLQHAAKLAASSTPSRCCSRSTSSRAAHASS